MPDILLSICIPTYNRSEYLEKTLLSITQQDVFSGSSAVEIVISDNCSTDDTRDISEKYAALYPGKVLYFRNTVSLGAANVEKVLEYGRGLFLKLNNDTLLHKCGSLDAILNLIEKYRDTRENLFLSNGLIPDVHQACCKDLDSFVATASFHVTWIACFGIWRDDYLALTSINKSGIEHFIHVECIFSLISSGRAIVVDNSILFELVGVKKGGYNLYRVFVTEYIGCLERYNKLGHLSARALRREKSVFLRRFLIHWTLLTLENPAEYSFELKGGLGIVMRKYYLYPGFYAGVVYLCYKLACTKMSWLKPRRLIRKLESKIYLSVARKLMKALAVGNDDKSYSKVCGFLDDVALKCFIYRVKDLGGPPCVRHPVYMVNPEYIHIGAGFRAGPGLRIEAVDTHQGVSYLPIISIGKNVNINWNAHIGAINRIEIHDNVLIGSNVLITDHGHGDTSAADLAMPPLYRKLTSKGPVVIEANVWIGENVSILGGVRIGKGAVVGANSVVTSDVAPGSVVGGVPARQIMQQHPAAGD